jgi:hypothetical protein
MIGKNSLWVAQQHGHSIVTMLTVYAAWTQALRGDVAAIRRALRAPAFATRERQETCDGSLPRVLSPALRRLILDSRHTGRFR